MRPIVDGRGRYNRIPTVLFGTRFGRRSDAIPGLHALPSITSQQSTDNEAPLAHAHQLLQCGINKTIDSPAGSELWTFQEPRAMSWQAYAIRCCLVTVSDISYATRVLPYIATLHTCRERIRY